MSVDESALGAFNIDLSESRERRVMDEPAAGLPRKTTEEFTTQELADALKAREETDFSHVASSAYVSLNVNGPADVLVVKHHA